MTLTATMELPCVLVVEDEGMVAEMVSSVLTEAGYAVLGPFATTGEAFDALATAAPSAAVLDIGLGGQSSYGLADRLVADGVPVVFYTGRRLDQIPSPYCNQRIVQKGAPIGRLESALAEIIPTSLD